MSIPPDEYDLWLDQHHEEIERKKKELLDSYAAEGINLDEHEARRMAKWLVEYGED